MNTILILFVACIAATTANHANYRGGENYFGGAPQRELVDVPYTIEYRNTGSQGSAYGRNYQYEQKSYPQPEISRAELIYQNHQSSPRQEIQQIPYQTHSAPQVQAQYQPQRHYQQIPQQRTYSVPQQQPTYQPSRQLVDVPYTTEVRRGHSAPVQQPQRSYLPPQSQVVNQRTYSKPVQQQPQRQAKHYVDVPYTVETRSGGNSNAAAAGYRYSPLTTLQVQSPQPQRAQLVDVPYQVLSGGVSSGSHGGNYPVLPYTFGNSHSISTIGTGSASLGFPTTPVGLSSLIY